MSSGKKKCVWMNKKRIFAIHCLLAVFSSTASQDVSVALIPLPGVLEAKTPDAPYNRFIEYIKAQSELNWVTEYYPYVRAEQKLLNQQVDCIFPVVRGDVREQVPTLISETVNRVSVHLFSLTYEYKSFDEIAGSSVIHLNDFEFGYWSLDGKDKVSTISVLSQEAAMNVLKSGRATAYIDYYPDIKLSFPENDYAKLKFSLEDPINEFEDVIECTASEKNQHIVNILNTELRKMKSSGKLRQLLGAYYNFP